MISCALHTGDRTIFLADKRSLAHLRSHGPACASPYEGRQLLRGDHTAFHRLHRKVDLVFPLGRHIEHRRQHPCAALLKLGLQPLFQMLVLKNTRIQLPCRMLDHLRKTVKLFGVTLPVLHHLIIPHHDLLRILERLQGLS